MLVLVGCDQSSTLFNGVYSGQSSYAATVTGNADGFAGASPLTVADDGDNVMTFGSGCTLTFDNVMLATDSRDQGTSATAMLEGTSCAVDVAGGSATFTVMTSSATSTGGTSLIVAVGGNIASWLGAATTGYISVMFQGTLTSD